MPRLQALLAAAVAVAVGAAAAAVPAQAPPTPLTTVVVASGLDRLVWVGVPPGDRTRLFAIECWRGRVRIVENGTVLPTPFLDLGGMVATGGEQGLLGLAFHPHYASNGFFYVHYTRVGDNAVVIARYRVSAGNPDVADPASVMTVLVVPNPTIHHNGGCLRFGPDGYLYISIGDGNDANCPSQRGNTLLGKILRLDVDAGEPYAVPPTNPFVADPAVRDEIWHLGWRNPWRFSFDRATGDMYIGDVGLSTREEVSFQPRSSGGGEDYGWPLMEGSGCGPFSCVGNLGGYTCSSPQLVPPIWGYTNTGNAGNCCVVGGHVYRGCAIPDLQGTYFCGDMCSGRIWSFRKSGQQITEFTDRTAELTPASAPRVTYITSFGEDDCGELYVTGLNGRIYKIVPATPMPPAAIDLGYGKVGSNGLVPTFAACGVLRPGLWADFTLRQAPAAAPAALLLSAQQQPLVVPFGTIVPMPVQLGAPFVTDPAGEVTFRAAGAPGPYSVYGQFFVLDPGASGGIGVSNALRIDFP